MGRPKGSVNRPGSRKPGPKETSLDRECSLQEIADEWGCSRQNISVIELRALAKLRTALEARGIDEQLWLDHMRDLHRLQKTAYSVSGAHVAASRFRSVDEAEEVTTCNAEQSE